MNNLPDFSSQGYKVIRELGQNRVGGRVTYLATSIEHQSQVVIKQFQFATNSSSWAGYSAYLQEIQVLRSLNQDRIPRYLDSFQTEDGFCMVQEYKNALDLTTPRTWTPQHIKQVAISVLEILVYLQNQKPPIIHRDIKPENILFDDELNVYLVDFGFARVGGVESAASSVVKGTLGFMPPEQLFNRQLTAASDLYGLGATLICLLTGTKSVDIGSLIDSNYRIHFQHLVPPLQRGWMNWLSKMVEPRPQERYSSAAEALAALEPIDVNRLPKVRLSRDRLKFTASVWGEKLTQTIQISNPIPETVLAGAWEVAHHPNDFPHTREADAWIEISPRKFEGNQVECEVAVDTRQLLANQTYTRELLLHTNSSPEPDAIAVEIHTAPLPEIHKPPLLPLAALFSLFWIAALLCFSRHPFLIQVLFFCFLPVFAAVDRVATAKASGVKVNLVASVVGAMLGAVFVTLLVFPIIGGDLNYLWLLPISFSISAVIGAAVGFDLGINWSAVNGTLMNIGIVVAAFGIIILFNVNKEVAFFLLVTLGGFFLSAYLFKFLVGAAAKAQTKRGFSEKDAVAIALLTSGLSISSIVVFLLMSSLMSMPLVVTQLKVVLHAVLAIALLGGIGFRLANLMGLKKARLVAKYRRAHPYLIKS